jgi:hypothetical protein
MTSVTVASIAYIATQVRRVSFSYADDVLKWCNEGPVRSNLVLSVLQD